MLGHKLQSRLTLIAFLLNWGGAAAAGILLKTPGERQVLQRGMNNDAEVHIAGTASNDIAQVHIKIADDNGVKFEADQPVLNGSFEYSLRLPASKAWYSVQVTSGVDEASVERFGVGEVFLIAGQSNSTNSGDVRQNPRSDFVSSWNGNSWQLAKDPQPLAMSDGSDGGSPWPVMGDLLYEAWQVPVAFVSVGWGGTRVKFWQPDNPKLFLYPRLREQLKRLGPGGFRAVLWHQGESDARLGTWGGEYQDYLERVIAQTRKDAGFPVPWFVAKATYHGPKYVGMMASWNRETVRRAQQHVIDKDPLVFAGPDTDQMLGNFRGKDGLHFSDAGLKEHGKQWAEILKRTF